MYVRPRARFRPRNAGGAPFSPAMLFTGGVQGAWYDPSDVLLNWRTNLLTWTQQFDNATWTKLNATITSNAAVAPDGTTTASLVTSTGGETRVGATGSVAALNTYTASIFAKYSNSNGRYLWFRDFFASKDTCFDLLNGIVVSAPAGTTATITAQANGFYRCTTTWTTPASAVVVNQQYWVQSSSNSSPSLGTTGGEFYIWGAQLELGSTATAYQAITTPEQTYLLYDPQPVLFQDSSGTTPVTAVEQPVGLMLDKSQGLVIGPELITNGGPFTTTTGWTAGNNAVLSATGGRLRVTNNVTDYGQAGISFTTVAGTWYAVTFSSFVGTSGFFRLTVGSSVGSAGILGENFSADTGTITRYFLATGTTTWVTAQCNTTNDTAYVELGSMSVKSIAGNHASQATAASRPVLRARYNNLTYSEQFDNAAWTKSAITISANAGVAPDGTTTADKFIPTVSFAAHNINQTVSSTSGTFSIYAKADGETSFSLWLVGASIGVVFDLTAQTASPTSGSISGTIQSVGSGWFRCTATSSSATTTAHIYARSGGGFSGDGTSGIYLWGADLRTGSSAGTYQRIAAATDYATAGFLPYLYFVTDDSFSTGSINFTGTNKMSVVSGLTKLSDSAVAALAELGSSGSYTTLMLAPGATAGNGMYRSGIRDGTNTAEWYADSALVAPRTNVVSVLMDRAAATVATQIYGRVNGAVNGVNSGTAIASSSFTNDPIYIGRRGGSTLPFNGNLYGLIVCGKALSASELSATESWMNSKTGAY